MANRQPRMNCPAAHVLLPMRVYLPESCGRNFPAGSSSLAHLHELPIPRKAMGLVHSVAPDQVACNRVQSPDFPAALLLNGDELVAARLDLRSRDLSVGDYREQRQSDKQSGFHWPTFQKS